jgi:hypothetical protein
MAADGRGARRDDRAAGLNRGEAPCFGGEHGVMNGLDWLAVSAEVRNRMTERKMTT